MAESKVFNKQECPVHKNKIEMIRYDGQYYIVCKSTNHHKEKGSFLEMIILKYTFAQGAIQQQATEEIFRETLSVIQNKEIMCIHPSYISFV